MLNEKLGVYVAVISHARQENIGLMEALCGKATWFVGKGEGGKYSSASAVVEAGGLCESRNAALRRAWALGFPCLQLSDDCKGFAKVITAPGEKNRKTPIGIEEVVEELKFGTKSCKAYLAGVAPTANPFFSTSRFKTNLFIVGDLFLAYPTGLYFDENLKLKEDYDYTLQHLKNFGSVARCDYILAEFLHRKNPGGAVEFRTEQREQEAIRYLKMKWPGKIKDNAKRPNEILLAK